MFSLSTVPAFKLVGAESQAESQVADNNRCCKQRVGHVGSQLRCFCLLIMLVSAGDGLADVVGRRIGGAALPHNKTKVGSKVPPGLSVFPSLTAGGVEPPHADYL